MDADKTPEIQPRHQEIAGPEPADQNLDVALHKHKRNRKRKADGPLVERDAGQRKVVYEFPGKGRQCPRCKCWDTQARSTQGNVQYRICRRAICRQSYTVIGVAVEQK